MLVRGAAIVLAAGLLAGGAQAQPSVPGSGVQASQAWSRTTPAGADSAAVYVTLQAPVRDRLVGITSPEAKTAAVGRMVVDGDAVTAREVAGGLDLPPGQPVSLQPDGYLLMLSGLHGPLKLGDTFPLHLTFQVSPPIDIVARVAAVGASAGDAKPQ